MTVTGLSKGTKIYLLVGGKGERLSSVTNGKPKPLVEVNGKPFIHYVLDTLYDSFERGCPICLVCSNETYPYFKGYRNIGLEVINEGDNAGTAGFLSLIGIFNIPDSFYVMNGDTFFTGNLNLRANKSTVFVAEESVTPDVGYIKGKRGKVTEFIEKNPEAVGEEKVSLGIYKLYKKDLNIPHTSRLPVSMEYDILPTIGNLNYKILDTVRFDIGTPERLEKFKTWLPT